MTPSRYLRAAVLLVTGAALILLLLTLLAHSLLSAPIRHFDLAIPLRLHALASPALTRVMLAFTWLGALRTILPALGLAIIVLILRQCVRQAVWLAGTISGALILNESLKLYFHRARPVLSWNFAALAPPPEHTFSFPSGHALFATVLYGTLACIGLRQPAPRLHRLFLCVLAGFMPLAIGLSRIYLGMHYPTDVLAGYIAGGAWLGAVSLARQRLNAAPPQPPTPLHRVHNGLPGRP